MSRQPKEYALADLIENPGLGLVMQYDGIDRRSLDLLFESRREDRRQPRFETPFAG